MEPLEAPLLQLSLGMDPQVFAMFSDFLSGQGWSRVRWMGCLEPTLHVHNLASGAPHMLHPVPLLHATLPCPCSEAGGVPGSEDGTWIMMVRGSPASTVGNTSESSRRAWKLG